MPPQQLKRTVRQLSSSETTSPPRKKTGQRTITEEAVVPTTDESDESEIDNRSESTVDMDSDLGPEPDKKDVDAWIIRFSKTSKRQEKRLAKIRKNM